MTDYPTLTAFNATLTAQHVGIMGATIMTAIVLYYARYLITRYPSGTKFAVTAGYYALWTLSQITIMPAVIAISYVAHNVRLSRKTLWVAIFALAIGVRLVHINDSFWYDEAFTAVYAQNIAHPMNIDIIIADVHPPYWYLLSSLFNDMGTEAAYRIIPFLAGIAVLYVSYHLANHWALSTKTRMLLLFLLAILPAQVYYSNEARAYMLIVLLVLSALKNVESDNAFFATIALTLLGMLHHIAHLYTAVICVLIIYRYGKTPRWLAAIAFVGMQTFLALPLILAQSRDIVDGFWLPAFSTSMMATPMLSMTVGLDLPPYALWLAFIPIALTLLSARWVWQQWLPLYRVSWFAIVLGVPTLLAAASLAVTNVYLERALLPVATLVVMAWADMLANTTDGYNKIARFVAINALVFLSGYALLHTQRIDNRSIVNACGDYPVIATTISTAIIATAYADDVIVWVDANDLNQTLTEKSKQRLFALDELDELPERFCLLNGYNALNRQDERELVNSIISSHQLASVASIKNDVYTLEARVLYGR